MVSYTKQFDYILDFNDKDLKNLKYFTINMIGYTNIVNKYLVYVSGRNIILIKYTHVYAVADLCVCICVCIYIYIYI